ncbi:MAG: sulfatase-like hydrolase/transferase [Armatimonadota bacterium]|nr:sulfatase-like hydrolase/transferase [Armatimonadota bacterium]
MNTLNRPNVLLLYTDQQRWDTVRAAGNPLVHTPNLDRLAASGVLFDNCFVNNPVCMPSRQSMLTGQYPNALGCATNGIELPESAVTLHKLLKPYGYFTANVGKLHFRNHSNRDHRDPHPNYGFDALVLSDEPGCYDDAYVKWVEGIAPDQVERCRVSTPPAWQGPPRRLQPRNTHEPYLFEADEGLTHSAFVASESIRLLRQNRGRPFFLIAGFYAPHCPINPPARFVEMYDAAAMPLPQRNPGENFQDVSDAQWRKVKAYYYALISHVDDQMGRILAFLDEEGLTENTLILFTSDHGEHLGDHGLVGKGPFGYDSCTHVPLILSFPGRIPAGDRRQAFIEHVDLAPTILDYCGVQTPRAFQGRTFRPLLEGRPYRERSSVYTEWRNPYGTSWKSVRSSEYKYACSNREGEVLFDLRCDPNELRNVVAEPRYASALAEMRAELLRRWFEVEKQEPLRTAQY